MTFLLSLLFIIYSLISAFLQASDNPLKNKVSPGLTAFCVLLILFCDHRAVLFRAICAGSLGVIIDDYDG